jgi:hypothetical protein
VSADGAYNLALTAPGEPSKLFSNVTNLTFLNTLFPGCVFDCRTETVVPLEMEFIKTQIDVQPRTKTFAAGTPGDHAYTYTVYNPSDEEQSYSLEIISDELGAPAAFTDTFSPFMNLTLMPGEEKVGTIDLITALSGIYGKTLVLRSHKYPSDNSSIPFEARINTEVRSLIFTYYVITDLDFLALLILFFSATVMFLSIQKNL